MSEKFLISSRPLLDTLLKNMLYRLNNYPMLAVKYEKVEYFCSRFQMLFNGEYRPINYEISLLHSCTMQYCKCVLIFIQDNLDTVKKDEVDYLNRWLSVLDNLGGVDSIKNKFTFFMPVLENSIYEDLPLWIKKIFMVHLNRIFEKPTQLIFSKKEKKYFLFTMAKWLKLLITCGDYEFQTILVEAIISTCELCDIEEVLRSIFGKKTTWTQTFLEVYSKQNYVNDLKTLLIVINDSFGCVRSIPCLKVILEETVIPPLKGMNPDTTWMHVNYGFSTLSFGCHQDSLRSLPGSTNRSNSYEFVTVNFEDVGKICLLINNDSKTVNSVGGIFLINLTGKCSCRFDSSKEIVSSIKKIILTVPDGLHLQFLKKEFATIFGKKFKEDSNIPTKKKRDFEKRDSQLTSSTQNSSYQAKNRRRTKKLNDSTMSRGSVLKQNIKLENSLTLENKEYVLEDTTECFLNSTESTSKKNIVVDNKEATNSQTKFINNKENEIVNNSSAKHDYKNKNDTDNSEYCRLFASPDTTTNEFMNDERTGSIISPHSTNKAKKGKGERGTTKKKLSLLKNLDIDILTVSKTKEIPESSRISSVLATTEEMNIPSNHKFEGDNSLIISEENKSLILDFINDELNSIPDLRSPLGFKKKSSKIKTSKAKKVKHTSNSGIADSSSMKANSSVSKTISSARNDGLHLDVTPTQSSSTVSQLNDLQKPKTTYKCKKNTSSVTSNNSLKHLSKHHKQDREHRRMKNKESIDKSETVNSLLHSSETVESDFLCANPKRSKAPGSVYLKKKGNEVIDCGESNYNLRNENKEQRRNALNIKMPDSYALQSTEENITKKSNRNKNLISNAQVGFCNKKKSIKIDRSYSLGNTEVINERAIEKEIVNEEESEYHSITQDDVPSQGNKESNQIGNVEVVYKKATENDNLLTLDNDTVNVAETEYYSFNSETPDLNVKNLKEKTDRFKSHPLEKLMLMNSEEIIKLSVKENNQQILGVERNENCSIITEDNTSFQNNSETPSVNLNFCKGANISNSELRKLKEFDYSKNKQESIIEQDRNNDVMLGQQESEYYSCNPDIISTENNEVTSGICNSESLELNFNPGNNESIATLNMGNKNGGISKTSSLNELSKTNNSFTLKNTTEQSVNSELMVQRVNSTEENEIFSNALYYQESNRSMENSETPDLDIILAHNTKIISELKNANENTNEEMSINALLSAETVKINNCSFHSNIQDDIIQFKSLGTTEEQMRNDDDISIISISSMEEIDSDASTKVMFDLQTHSLENQQIENKQCDDVPKTDVDLKKNEASEHNSFTEKIKTVKYNDELKIDSDIKKIQILEINNTIINDYSANQSPKHEIAKKTKNDQDHFIKFASIESKGSPSFVDDVSAPKEINEFDVCHIDSELDQLTAVPILLNEIDHQENAGTVSNKVLDLNRTNFDGSLTDLLNEHQENLNKSNKSIEKLENSFKSMKSKNMEHISSNISCDDRNASVVRNKINILSNIRIKPPFCSKINQPDDDVQLLNEKYFAECKDLQESKNETAKLRAQLAYKTEKLEELERINKERLQLTQHISEPNKVCGKKSVTCKKRKQTKEHITSKSKNNSEISNKKFKEINSFQEFIESPCNRLPDNNFLLDKFLTNQKTITSSQSEANFDENNIFEKSDEETNYFQNLEKPLKSLPTKKLLRNKFSESTQSTPKTNITMESDFEMLISRNELNSRDHELSPEKTLFDEIATNEKNNVTPLVHELEISQKFTYPEEFSSSLFNKSPLNQSDGKENKRKFSQDGEEISITSPSQNAEKRIRLAEDVQLSHKMHKSKDSVEKFTFERSPLKKFNEDKKSTSGDELTQKIPKSKVCDLEMMETQNKELDQSREFVSIRNASEKSFATSNAGTKKLTDVRLTTKTRKSKKENEDLSYIQLFEAIPKTPPQLHTSEPVTVRKLMKKVQSGSREKKSQENSLKRLEVIDEEFGLLTKQSTISGNELNKNIEFDDIQMDHGGLYNLISKPYKLYEKSDKTFKVGRGIRNKRKEVHRDEHYYNTVDKIYGFDAMLSGLTTYLKTWKSPKERSKKRQKRRIINMKFGSHNKAKNRLTKEEIQELLLQPFIKI